MARHRTEESETVTEDSPDRADEQDVDAEATESTAVEESEADEQTGAEPAAERTPEADAFWAEVRIDPVEIALPSGVGYTLRAYRLSDELTPDEEPEPTEDEDTGAAAEVDEPAEEAPAKGGKSGKGKRAGDEAAEDGADSEDDDSGEASDDEPAEPAEDELAEEAEEDEETEPEEIPVFLSHRGRLLLFQSPEQLVEFVRSDAPHELARIDSWRDLVEGIQPEYLVPTDEDRYELDLVVQNLRGGRDAWDPELVISAGEVARDLGYALRIEPVLTSLSAGSPLDELDDALRTQVKGGIGSFFARRRMRRVSGQQVALAWRTIVGKISSAVDWRE